MRRINKEDADDSAKEEETTQSAYVRDFIRSFKQMDEKHLKDAQNLPG